MPPMLIDSHCHLTHGKLLSRADDVLAEARQAGVIACVTCGGDVADSRAAVGLAGRHDDVYCSAGVHPHEAKDVGEHYLTQLEQIISAGGAKCVAVGEIGLDFHYDFSPRGAQREVFVAQLALAERLGKPVIIHVRAAADDALAILGEFAGRLAGVIHSFTGGPDEVGPYIDQGWHIGFAGIVTFARSDANRDAAAIVPAERLLVETDSPYLSPEPVRKQHPNTPANVAHVAACLAGVCGETPDALARQTTANAARLFGIPLAFGGTGS